MGWDGSTFANISFRESTGLDSPRTGPGYILIFYKTEKGNAGTFFQTSRTLSTRDSDVPTHEAYIRSRLRGSRDGSVSVSLAPNTGTSY